MRDPGVPSQLEFFSEADLTTSAQPGKATPPPSTGRLSHPVTLESFRPVIGFDPTPSRLPVKPAKPNGRFQEGRLTAQAAELVLRIGLETVAARVSVRWNSKMRTAAGRAFYETFRIELNPRLLHLDGVDGPSEIDRTLRHELAHLVAFHRAGGRRIEPHGTEWQQACADLGIPGEARCHTLPLEARRVAKRLAYECPACGSQILRVRKFRRIVACYDCCRLHSGGKYDDRFRLKAKRLPRA